MVWLPYRLTPNSVQAGNAGFTLTINGSNFLSTSSVYWDDKPYPVNYLSPSILTVEIPASEVAVTGNYKITVINNSPGGGNVSTDFAVGTGMVFPANSQGSDQKVGSVLVYNLYSSTSANQNSQNTHISITNMNQNSAISVHLFFVDGSNCSVADAILCLSPNQTTGFLASDIDPGITGYIVAVAIDSQTGCPTNFNFLIGDEYIKLTSGHSANLGAEAFAALNFVAPHCDANSSSAVLKFDGINYNAMPRALAISNIQSRVDGNETLLVLNRIGGDLSVGASVIDTLAGVMFNDIEMGISFTIPVSACQLRSSLSNNLPRITPRFEQFIPAGGSGWMKIWGANDVGILGAAINFNSSSRVNANAYNQGHNLHKLSTTTAVTLTIPIFPPSC